MEEKLNKGKDFIVDRLQMPKEVVYDIPKIIITGDRQIEIENHKGIITFDKTVIKINSKLGPIKILGEGFEILFIAENTISLSGKFKSVEYSGGVND